MARTVLTAAERIESKFKMKWEKAGKEILDIPPAIPTGSLQLDEAIGDCKGYPEGCIIEAYGPQHSGKTLMGYLAIAASQRAHSNRDHLIIDAENQFKFQARWAQQVGVDVEKLYVSPSASAEESFDVIEMAILGEVELDKDGIVTKVIKPGNFGIIMIDSVTQLTPLEMIHKGMDDGQRMAALAAVMSRGLKKVVSAMSLTQSKTILFFVNQIRANPKAMPGTNPETRTGGMALPFYDTISMKVSKVKDSDERDSKGKIFAHRVKIKFTKNKAGQLPKDSIIFRLRYDGTGIDNDEELFSVGVMNGILEKVRGGYTCAVEGIYDEVFKEEEFGEVATKCPKLKEIILQKIKDGKFYHSENVEEAVPEDEITESKKEKKTEDKEEEKKPVLVETVPEEKIESEAITTPDPKIEPVPEEKQRRRRRRSKE